MSTRRISVTIRGMKRITRRWDGAGDLISETIDRVDRASGGLLDRASGGRITGDCDGCDRRRQAANEIIRFR